MPPSKRFTVDLEDLKNIRKFIDSNGCWIPYLQPNDSGYVEITFEGKRYKLHRLIVALSLGISYNDNFVTRHGLGCDRRCFNLDHLKIGSDRDNSFDSVEHGTHKNTQKLRCPKCGDPYKIILHKVGPYKGRTKRYCRRCSSNRRSQLIRERRIKKK